jgi:two-component system chemotaxis response regulator CheB
MKTRVLIVDDSVVVRKLVSDMIAAEPDLEVAGIAHHGKIALQKIPQVNPDVITLDVDMPEMNGIETLLQIRELYPTIPVLMLSGLTVRSAQLTFDALSMGAADYVAKPTTLGLGGANLDKIREELVAKIRALSVNPRANRVQDGGDLYSNRVDIIGIGVSTGGPTALGSLLSRMPANLPVPIIIIQHIPAQFTTHFVDRLRTKSAIPLEAAETGSLAKPGTTSP